MSTLIFFSLISIFTFCKNPSPNVNIKYDRKVNTSPLKGGDGNTIITRFSTPEGYERQKTSENSFQYYLQSLPLKPVNSKVKLYNGQYKSNTSAYVAVVNLPIGNKDLHQCADAVMRLRSEYLFSQKRYEEIHFNSVSGKQMSYLNYLYGKTPTSQNLWSYLEYVFSYANTYSLEKEMKRKSIKNLEIGDVFIKGGFPGHVVIVVDKCVNKNGDVKFMLAQSYMPAQEIQILVNPLNSDSPWYDADFGDTLYTAEWNFDLDQLRTF